MRPFVDKSDEIREMAFLHSRSFDLVERVEFPRPSVGPNSILGRADAQGPSFCPHLVPRLAGVIVASS